MTLKSQLWNEMLEEYCNRHHGGGLTWWQAPLEEQPQEFKAEMYDILWTILNKEKEYGTTSIEKTTRVSRRRYYDFWK